MIETTITKIQYDADGVQRRWSIPFPYADVKHISIYTKVVDEPTVKVVDNYDIDEDDSVVIYPTVESGQEPLTAGTKITIARETPETQLEDASQVHFTSKDVERGLDKLTMITQELSTTAGETMEVSAAAFESAEEAVSTANEANATADEAKTLAGQAVSVANDANATATSANTKSDTAIEIANDANEKSASAVSTASAAKTVVDEANSTANKANAIATEAKEIAAAANVTAINADKIANEADKKVDNAIIIANNAKSIAEGIDAKAVQALDNSNTAINTANSAKQTAEGIDGKATQALTNSTTALETATEAKNTADSYQGQITTIRNDVDDLGDQISVIESKIPDDATEQNQLVTKTQMETAIAGSSVDLTGYYNRDNLLGADEIEIVPEPVDGGIDEHTLACWHFDNSLLDEVSQLSIRNTNTAIFVTGKFGKAVGALYGGRPTSDLLLTNVLNVLNDWTVDCDVVINGSATDALRLYVGGEYSSSQLSAAYVPFTGSCSLSKYGTQLISTTIEAISVGEKPHFAFQKKGNKAQIFINGKKVIDYDLSSYTLSSSKGFKTTGGSAVCIDELRISDIARYTEDFEPPTKPYALAVPTGNYVVRNKTELVHKSDIGIANGVASLDASGKVPAEQIYVATTSTLGGVKPDGTTITATEDGTISAVGDSGFDFEGTKAEFDAAVAAGTITEDSVSLITDDVDGANVATKAELQAVDRSKADTALSNVLANIDYVVESKFPTADDPTWYRVYKSGWVEQGGTIDTVNKTITFLKPFADTNYTLIGPGFYIVNAGNQSVTKTTVGFTTTSIANLTAAMYWEAKGRGAE